MVNQAAIYIIQSCPQRVVETIKEWIEVEDLRACLLRPLALEALLIDEVAWMWSQGVLDDARSLLRFVSLIVSHQPYQRSHRLGRSTSPKRRTRSRSTLQ